MRKILIANRGEIAVRIIRACRDAGYGAVAVASEPDRRALHARMADELYVLRGSSPRETYLNQSEILAIADRCGADAVHPGYGLLSENETFAAAVEAAGLVWIGPSPEAISLLGDKVKARTIARNAGALLLPSLARGAVAADSARAFIAEHGLPIIVKAQNGGGGRGMRIVREESELEGQLAAAAREAQIAFGRPECFLERYVDEARHVETQCLGDGQGGVIVLSTRDCTLQRRHQKLIEEAPAPFLNAAQNATLIETSIRILASVRYRGAGTCEFLLTPEGDIYFLEVNTRLQVEHPVTEEVTGIDIIREMFNIAEGRTLPSTLPAARGHSIEFRINAEDPWADFRPVPGKVDDLRLPAGPGVRLDFGYAAGDSLPAHYDSLLGKLIVTGRDRIETIARARRALAELWVGGIPTLVPLHRAILEQREFSAASAQDFTVHTRWIDAQLPRLATLARAPSGTAAAAMPELQLDDQLPAGQTDVRAPPAYRHGIKSPLSGVVLEVCVSEGDSVAAGDCLAILESMKMEQTITADGAGVVAKINVTKGSFVEMNADIMGLD